MSRMVFILACTLPVLLFLHSVTSQGTSEDLPEVFKGRCYDYDVTRYNGLLQRVDASCEDLWEDFYDAFAYKRPCNVSRADYDKFMEAARQPLPKDKAMFWSGVYTLAHEYSNLGRRYITLEDTLIGYLANSLTWCGQTSSPGINYTICPQWTDCPTEASESFWSGASTVFASEAVGNVTLMLDGSNPNKPAYRRDSFFSKYELPNLNVTKVPRIHVMVTHALDKPKLETCGYGTLLMLKSDIEARGLEFSCTDDPEAVMFLLCSEDPDSRECNLASAHMSGDLQCPVDSGNFNQLSDIM